MAIYNYSGQDITPSGGGSASTRVGEKNFSTPFNTQFSRVVELVDKVRMVFNNYSDMVSNWHNFSLKIETIGSSWITRKLFIRPDNFAYIPSEDSGKFTVTSGADWDWGTFTQALNGSLVDIVVEKNYLGASNVIRVDIDVLSSTGKHYHQWYTITVEEGYANGNPKLSLTVENSYIEIPENGIRPKTAFSSIKIGDTSLSEAELIAIKSLPSSS